MGTSTDAVGSMRGVALELVDVWFKYPGLSDYVLRGVNLKITDGLTVIVGENGSGKTTLLMIMAGLLRPERGKVLLNGMDIFKEIRRVRGIMGVVFQDPDDQLFNFTVYDELAYTIRQMGFGEDYVRRRITEVSELLGIKHLLDRNPLRLSYGEKKLVTIASALVHDPEIVLLDEPTAFLSRRHARRIISIIKQLLSNSKTLVIATHDPCLLSIAKSVVILRNGMAETMSVTEAYNDEYVSDLLGLNRDCARDA